MGAVDTVEWACVLCGRHIQNDWVSTAMNLHQILCQAWTFLHRNYSGDSEGCTTDNWWWAASSELVSSYIMSHTVFWRNIKSPRWLSSPRDQIWCSLTSGFSQNWNHLWKGRAFRPSIRFRKITMEQLMMTGRTVWGPKVSTLKGTKVLLSYIQCFLYLVSSVNVSIFHSTQLDTF